MDNPDQKLYTTEEVAKILNVDPESVRRYTRSGELKSMTLGKRFIRVSKEDLDNFIAQRKSTINKPPPVKAGSVWHSPISVYWHIHQLEQELGREGLLKHPDYKLIREAQVASVVALIMFRMRNISAFVQLYKPDPPDALIMQPSIINKGQLDISMVELTQYMGNTKESLFDQLKRTKMKPGIQTLSEFYVLVVDLWPGIEVSDEELKKIADYLLEDDSRLPVWIVQETQATPDTTAKLIIVNPGVQKMDINLGELAFIYKKLGVLDTIQIKRTGNPDLVRVEKSEESYGAPWETIGK